MRLNCSNCKSPLIVHDDKIDPAGTFVRCPACNNKFLAYPEADLLAEHNLTSEKTSSKRFNFFRWGRRSAAGSAEQTNEKSSSQIKTKSKNSGNFFSIKWRFAFIYSAFLLITFLGLFFTINMIFQKHSANGLQSRVLSLARSFATSATTPILGKKMDVLNTMMHDLSQLDPDISYIISNYPGRRMVWHNLSEGIPEELVNASNVAIGGKKHHFSFIKTELKGIHEAMIPILGGKGSIHVGISDERIAQNIRESQVILLSVMMISILIGASVSVLFAGRLTKPLIALATAADEISLGNTDVQIIKLKHQDEIKKLADAFERLRESFSIALTRMRKKRKTGISS